MIGPMNAEGKSNGSGVPCVDGVMSRENRLVNHFFHDFKGEISTVIMCLETLKDGLWGELNEKQITWVERAERNCEHMVRLINNYRDYTQMEEGAFPLESEVVDLEKTFIDLHAQCGQRAHDRGQMFVLEKDRALGKVFFRANVFNRLVQNLYELLLEGTRQGGRLLTRVSTPDNRLQIEISYEGVEFDEAQLATTFDKFAQAEVGLQLGRGYTMLFIKGAVNTLGGQIRLRPWPGLGNKVEIDLPLIEVGETG